MPGDYHILANFHTEIGMGIFAETMTMRLLDYAQRNGWLGRNIVDVGCGVGLGLAWLAQHGYIVTGIDRAAQMLQLADATLKERGVSASLLEQDLRKLDGNGEADLVLALDVMHEMNSLRDLEAAFQSIHTLLKPDKLFCFDFFTIEGLIQRQQDGNTLHYDDDNTTVIAQNQYDYERQIHHRNYIIFSKNNGHWQRFGGRRVLRSYPIQAVTALVQRSGFEVTHLLDMSLKEYTAGSSTQRVIIMAEKR